LVFGFAGSAADSRRFCGVFGTFYVALGVLGVIAGNAAANRMLDVGPMHLTIGDHLFHIVLGSIFVVSAVPRPRALPAHEMTNVS
jgi:predicted small integral membrane protein